MRVADYIFKKLADWGIRHVFMITGGGAMFLNDAAGREKRIKYICNLHEQACAMAAEGNARISGLPGAVCVTTGPGGTNAITGVAGAWLDSLPMIVISGQIKRETCTAFYPELKLRQLGDQELNIIDIVRPITKYAAILRNAADIGYELEKAWHLSLHGRPGPVWLDVPLDIQAAEIDESTLRHFEKSEELVVPEVTECQLARVKQAILKSKRPAIIAGIGVRHGKGVDKLLEFAEKHSIPLLTSISGIDLVESNHPLFFGRPGIMGERAANFIMQNSDLLLVLGTRMGLRITGYAYDKVAREAFRIMVDVDENELKKPTFKPHLGIHSDAGVFLSKINKLLAEDWKADGEWINYCRRMKNSFPVVTDEHRKKNDYVSSYVFPELLSKFCRPESIVVTGNGTAYTSSFQAFPLKKEMRMFANEACASMGYGLPAAIGAALAGEGREVLCITGDGSLQMNIQELQTVKNYDLPLKLFVYNNEGYLSIKLTQRAFFEGRKVGSDADSGVILPDLEKIAHAYGIPYRKLRNNDEAAREVSGILALKGPVIIEVMTDPWEILGPKAASKRLKDGRMVSAPLEDMAPFLPREKFKESMIISPDAEFEQLD